MYKASWIQSPCDPPRSARHDPRQEEALCRAGCSPKTKDIREGRQPEPPPHLGHAPCPLANSPQPHTLALCHLGTIRTRMVPGNGIRFVGAWGVGSASPPCPWRTPTATEVSAFFEQASRASRRVGNLTTARHGRSITRNRVSVSLSQQVHQMGGVVGALKRGERRVFNSVCAAQSEKGTGRAALTLNGTSSQASLPLWGWPCHELGPEGT